MQNEIDVLREGLRVRASAICSQVRWRNYYAQPRMTRDIDIVLELGLSNVGKLVRLFAPDSRSERQFDDIKNLIATGYDATYLGSWAQRLGLLSLWSEVNPYE